MSCVPFNLVGKKTKEVHITRVRIVCEDLVLSLLLIPPTSDVDQTIQLVVIAKAILYRLDHRR
jgi:hypothetical protein